MIEYVIMIDENDERWHYVVQQYTHFFGYPITERIVRCRDCTYYDEIIHACERFDSIKQDNVSYVSDNDFCAWGRKEERMNELKPCPFCGGEAETLTAESMHGGNLYGVMCVNCAGRSDVYDTEAEAIAAWNTRAERTCKEFGSVRVWQSCNVWSHELSCGHEVDTLESEPPNYCPNCGAKVQAND